MLTEENPTKTTHTVQQKLSEEDQQAILEIARKLNETQKYALVQISKIARICSMDFVRQTFEQTIEIETQGGLMVNNGKRRRTTGGVFFYLARGNMSDEQRRRIFPSQHQKQKARPFVWTRRLKGIQKIKRTGEIVDMRVKIMGYPGDVVRVNDAMMTQMQHLGGGATIPAGLPQMPQTQMTYTVYISRDQWKKVEKKLENPDRWLVVDGLLAPDPETDSFSVFATGVSANKAKKQTSDAQPEAQKTQPSAKTKSVPETEQPPALPAIQLDSPEAQQKLQDLHAAADKYRAKIAEIEELPEDQRFGLQMTQKLLAGIEAQIQTLTSDNA